MVFEENKGGIDYEKYFLHHKIWDIYMIEKRSLRKVKYSVEVLGSDRKKVLWEAVDDHVVEDPK